jgi:hypothetical protein
VTWKETAEAFADPRHNHHPLKMSKTRNILRLKKRSRFLKEEARGPGARICLLMGIPGRTGPVVIF